MAQMLKTDVSTVPRVWGGGTDGTVGIIAGQSVLAKIDGTVICAICAICAKAPHAGAREASR